MMINVLIVICLFSLSILIVDAADAYEESERRSGL